MSEEQEALAAEDEYVAAEVSGDEAVLNRMVDEKFVLNSATGRTYGKAELIELVLSSNMTDQTITERTVVVEGDTAIVCGTADIVYGEGDDQTRSLLRYTSTWVKRGGQWRFLALQMTPRKSPDER